MMSRKEAAELAARTLAAIPPDSDLAGIEACYAYVGPSAQPRHIEPLRWLAAHHARYTAGLVHTAALYGVTLDA